MESDDLTPSVPRKRSRSPSPVQSVSSGPLPPQSTAFSASSASVAEGPPSKRARKEVPSYDTSAHVRKTAGLAGNNPLSRRALKQDAKRSRKAARKAARAKTGGMEVDDEAGGLAFTFMAGTDGVVA